MKYDLVIKNGTIITHDEMLQADLSIMDGKVSRIDRELSASKEIDASGKYVIPGGIDPHVHIEMDAGTIRTTDNFESASIAAAFGGTTTFIDFIEPQAGETLSEALNKRRAQADGKSALDYGLHMTIVDDEPATLAMIPEIVRQGVRSFKTYLTYTGFVLRDDQFIRVLESVKEADGLVLCHAENHAVIEYLRDKMISARKTLPIYHALSRPAATEVEAITRAIAMAEAVQAPLYIVHITTSGGARAISEGKKRGLQVWGETCPQYLVLTDKELDRPDFEGAKYVCSPPLRTENDHIALWQALSTGALSTVGTDHCPFDFHGQKDLGLHNFSKIPGGIPGIEPRMLLIHEYGVRQGKITLNQWVEICSTNPARIFGLYPKKGSLLPGADADIVIFDPSRKAIISSDLLHERVDYTPYEGFEVTGLPITVIQRGRVLIRDREFVASKGIGQFLKR